MIRLQPPTLSQRSDLLEHFAQQLGTTIADCEDAHRLAMMTSGYLVADLQRLYRSVHITWSVACPQNKLGKGSPDKAQICQLLLGKLPLIKPSSLEMYETQLPGVAWDHVCGYDELKRKLLSVLSMLTSSNL